MGAGIVEVLCEGWPRQLDEQHGAEELTRIAGSTTIDDLADRDLVIEAATEHHETKGEVFSRLDEVTRPEVVLASNTRSIPIVELAAVTGRPAQVGGCISSTRCR